MTCSTCKYLMETEIYADTLAKQLFCGRFPPVPVVITRAGQQEVRGQLPPVLLTTWCGEWAPDVTQ